MATTKKYVSLEKLGLYNEKINKVISDGDAASLAEAKKYADGLASNYDAAGAAATAEANAKAYADGKDAAIAEAKKAGTDAQAAAETAQTDVDNLEKYVGTFTASEGVDTVIKYIDAKTENIASDETVNALVDRVTQAEQDIDALEADHLVKADKTELEGKITTAQTAADTAQGEVDALEIVVDTLASTHATDKKALEDKIAEEIKAVNDSIDDTMSEWSLQLMSEVARQLNTLKGEDTRIEGLVTAEVAKAREEEGKLDARLVEVETFFKTAEGETLDEALDTLVEIQKYVTDEGAAADQMVKDIADNKTAIEELDAFVGELPEGATHETIVEYVDASTAESKDYTDTEIGKINSQISGALQAVATDCKAYTDIVDNKLTGFTASVEQNYVKKDILTPVQTAVNDHEARLDSIEDKFGTGEGSVADQIADAISTEAARVDGELAKKVDKVDGKGLSTNDLTNELKAQYDAAYAHSQAAHAPADAQKNVIETVKVNGVALTVTDKAVDVAVPTDNAQLANGAGYLVASDIANKADKGTTLAAYGIADAYTSAQTDTAIANAVGQFVECSEEDINSMF